ncbi:AMP-binding protein [Flavobacterium sp.]|uniref:AMP-binding protein n=1 Tax=Flavobacterium sp. TaxID=239 RepID=UPI0028BD57EA|nr:AMP-binding protein [Flavobacterium sp.]
MNNRLCQIHPSFQFNGKSYSKAEFLVLAESFLNSEEDYKAQFGKFILEWFDTNDFIRLTTSGTTGKPKEIQLLKEAMLNSALATSEFFNLTESCKALHCLPTQYIAGKMMLVRALVCGWELDVVPPSSHPLDGNEKAYDFAAMVPLQVENSVDKLKRVKQTIIGGAKLNPILADKLKQLPVLVYETYGMTETITHIAAKKVQEEAFSILPGIAIHKDERDCLVIDAPRLSEELIVTNDVIDLVSENQFIWLGRHDNVINSGGIKLFPEKIEEKLASKISNRFFVIGKSDETLGEKLILVIEGEPFELPESTFENLDKYEKPREILFVSKFVETETGKIKRKKSIP